MAKKIIMLLALLSVFSFAEHRISRANYNLMEYDMSYDQVVAIMGPPTGYNERQGNYQIHIEGTYNMATKKVLSVCEWVASKKNSTGHRNTIKLSFRDNSLHQKEINFR